MSDALTGKLPNIIANDDGAPVPDAPEDAEERHQDLFPLKVQSSCDSFFFGFM